MKLFLNFIFFNDTKNDDLNKRNPKKSFHSTQWIIDFSKDIQYKTN